MMSCSSAEVNARITSTLLYGGTDQRIAKVNRPFLLLDPGVRLRAFAREQVVQHIQYCLDELLAEFEARIRMSHSAKALAQLDAREARGETLEAVDGRLLRAKLVHDIEALPDSKARRMVLEIRATIASGAAAPEIARAASSFSVVSMSNARPAAPRSRTLPPPIPPAAAPTRVPSGPPAAEPMQVPAGASLAARLEAAAAPQAAEEARDERPRLKGFGQRLAEATAAGLAVIGIAFVVWSAAQQASAERWTAPVTVIEQQSSR
jgi:hypothetical protein